MAISGPRIEITVTNKGVVEFHVKDVIGGGCKNLSQAFEQAAGGDLVSTTETAEAFEEPHQAEIEIHAG